MNSVAGQTPLVPVSWGEVIDKITILEIKSERLTKPDALANVRKELDLLNDVALAQVTRDTKVGELKSALRQVNEALWGIEDEIRDKEAEQDFGARFVELARSVYKRNDERAAIKREINVLLASGLVEEKSYKQY